MLHDYQGLKAGAAGHNLFVHPEGGENPVRDFSGLPGLGQDQRALLPPVRGVEVRACEAVGDPEAAAGVGRPLGDSQKYDWAVLAEPLQDLLLAAVSQCIGFECLALIGSA